HHGPRLQPRAVLHQHGRLARPAPRERREAHARRHLRPRRRHGRQHRHPPQQHSLPRHGAPRPGHRRRLDRPAHHHRQRRQPGLEVRAALPRRGREPPQVPRGHQQDH
ncbi:hypothetical protein BN1708_017570, partial [Verticillium longisporum]